MTGPLGLTHESAQSQLVELAHAHGWKHLHVRRTIGRGKAWTTSTNRKGWPDLLLWHPGRGGMCGIEIKVGRDVPTPEQLDVADELCRAGTPTVVVLLPRDWAIVDELLDRRNWSDTSGPRVASIWPAQFDDLSG